MPRRTLVGLVVTVVVLLATSAGRSRPGATSGELAPHVEGEVLIKFRPGTTRLSRDRVLVRLGAREASRVGRGEARRVQLSGLDVREAIERYAGHPEVEYVEPNYLISAAAIPNDQNFAAQWHLFNTGQSGGTPGADIRATSAWDVSTDAPNVLLAIIDSGIDLTHPDLAPNIFVNPGEIPNNGVDDDNNGLVDDVNGWNFGDGNNDPTDDNGHGTHVAGIAAAIGNNGIGVAGVAWNTKILPCRFLNAAGLGTVAGATSCVDYTVMMGADIINASFTGASAITLRDAVERSYEADVLFVAAAGNTTGGNNNDFFPVYPASYEFPNIVSVAATNHDDQLWPDSHFGPTTVDIAAPGVNILSTWPTGYRFLNGTSMAAPQVAGVAALIKERSPDIDVETLRQVIFDRSDPLPNLQGVVATGGRLNAFLAIADQDQVAPGAIDDVETTAPDATRIDVTWTATGDDGAEGRATRYEVRYHTAPIGEADFDSAALAADPPVPAPAGSAERMTVRGLAPDTTYYFAIKAFDEFNNGSPVSNSATGTTTGPPEISVTPERFDEELITGQDRTRTVTLRNDGAGEYTFRINPERPGTAQALRPIDPVEDHGDGVDVDQRWPSTRRGQASGPWGPPSTVPAADPGGGELSTAGSDPTGGLSVLLLESSADVDEIRDALAEFLDISVVDVFSGRFEPPALELLQSYDSVIVVANLPFEDPLAVGDVLADYVDGGGGLVLTLASFINGWQFQGRFLDEGYYPFAVGTGPIAGSTLGVFDATHPIMNGVAEVGGTLLGSVTVGPGAELVASWANGQPLVATRRGTIAAINVYVAGSGFWSGDVQLMLHNAAVWTSNEVSWIALEPATGVVPAGATLEVQVTFDATGLIGGGYDADIVLRGDDPANPLLTLPAHLDVVGAPDLATTPQALDFGQPFVGDTVERTLAVQNVGSETLAVTDVASDDPAFSAGRTSFTLSPGEMLELAVTFAPDFAGPVAATLTLSSNDPDEPALGVPLLGVGLTPPDVAVLPANMFDALVSGETSTQTLFITNEGGSDLVFQLEREELAARAGTRPAAPGPEPRPVLPSALSAADQDVEGLNPAHPRRDTAYDAPVGLPVHATGAAFELREDFEDGNFDGWAEVTGSNLKEVTDATAADETVYSYHQINQQAGHFNGIFHELPSAKPEYVGFWVRSGSTETNDAYFVLTGAGRLESIFFFAGAEGKLYINADVGGNTLVEYEADTWYFVEFRDIDFDARDFDYYVDSELVQENVPFRNPADVLSFLRVDLYNFNSIAQAWWDQIVIADAPPAQAIRLDPKSGVVPAGEAFGVEVTFDSRGLLAGDHFTNIIVESNDPDEPVVVVSTLLNVIGAPDIEFPDGVPDFGEVFVGTTATVTLRVANEGTDTLVVSSAAFDDPAFAVMPDTFTIEPRDALTLTLAYTATEIGAVDAGLTLISNDVDQSPLTLPFSAFGVEPPLIGIDPAAIDDELFSGENRTHVVSLTNSGGSELLFGVEVELLGAAGGVFSFYDGFEDGDLDGWGDQGGGGIKEVTDATAADGTRYSYHESNAPGGHLSGIFQPLDGAQPSYVSCWIRSTNRQTADSYVVLRDPDGRVAIFFFANNVGKLYVNADVGGNEAVDYTVDEWIRVEFKNIDFGRQTFDYWIDEELIQARIPFRNAGSIGSFQQLDLYSFDQGAEGFWDEILVADEEPVAQIAVSPQGGAVAPGERVDLSVRLDALRAAAGVNEFLIRIASNDPLRPEVTIPVTMRVIGAPDIDVPLTSLDFGTQFTGTTTALLLDVRNLGPETLTIDEIASDDPAFAAEPSSLQVEPFSSRQVEVRFSPGSAGAFAGSLMLRSNDPDEADVVVGLSAAAEEPPDISVVPDAFSEQMVSAEVRTTTMRIANGGVTTLNWSIFFEGLQPGWLRVAPRGGVLQPGAAADVELTLTAGPLAPGPYDVTMRVESNDPDEPVVLVPVTMLVAAAPVIAVSPDPLEFEDAFVGTTTTATLRISNLGDAPLEIAEMTVDEPQFSIPTTTLTVAPDTAESVEISFTPEVLETVEATLTITSNDPFRRTATVTLRGGGESPPKIVVSPTSFAETMGSFEVLLRQLTISNAAGAQLDFEIEVTGRGPIGGTLPAGDADVDAPATAGAEDVRPPEWLAPMATLGSVVSDGGGGPRSRPAVDLGKEVDTVIFREDFEDGEFLDTWTLEPSQSIRAISAIEAADYSTRSFREFESEEGHLTGIHQELPGLRPGYVGFWVRSSSLTTNDGYVVLRDSNLNEAIFFFLSEVGRIYCNAETGGDFSARYFEDRWMFIEFKNIDFESQRFDYYVNFQPFSRSVPFRNFGLVQDFSRIDLYNFTEGADAYWDEIVFAREAPFDGARVRPWKGTVDAGSGQVVNAIFDTRNLIDGRYEAEIHVHSNDPDEPEVVIPATIDHVGVVIISVTPDMLDFGEVQVGVPKLDRFTVINQGTATLEVSAVELDHPHFTVSVDSFVLGPHAGRAIEVVYDPPVPEAVETVMTIRSNDPDDPLLEFPIFGRAVIPPRLGLEPDVVNEALYLGQTSTRTIEVTNPGGLDLNFELDLRTPEGIPVPAESLLYDDDMESGDAGWSTQVFSEEDLWHRTDRDANSPATAWWCGDAATGHYATPYAISTALVSPRIDLRGMEPPIRVSFWENHITEPGFDQCMVDLSLDDGQTWIPMRGAYGSAPSGDTRGWQKRFLNLDAFGGEIVRVRFYFETLDAANNAFPGWFVDDVRVTALGRPFVTATPLQGTVQGGEMQEVFLNFDAFELRPPGVYEARANIASNDPFAPFTVVPLTLTVSAPGRLALPGDAVTLEAMVDTAHGFPVVFPPAGPGTLTVIADGDYDEADEAVVVNLESISVGSVGGSGTACAPVEGEFAVAATALRSAAADGLIEVSLRDTEAVDPAECESASHTVRLVYPRMRQQLDFGEVRVGDSAVRALELANVGNGALNVSSIASTNAEISIDTTELTLPPGTMATVLATWTPADEGPLGGTLVIVSDDPSGTQTTVGLGGLAEGTPPRAEVSPRSLEAALPPQSDRTKTKTILIANVGDGELAWSAEAPQMGRVLPESGAVPPGGTAEIAVTLDAQDRDEGDYHANLTITTNDPASPNIDVPVTLHVLDVELAMMKLDFTPKYAERAGTAEVYMQLPPGHDAQDVDLATIALNGVPADPSPVVFRDSNRDGVPELILQFDLEQLDATISPDQTIEVRVGGEVRDKAWFHGSKYVRGRLIVDPPE